MENNLEIIQPESNEKKHHSYNLNFKGNGGDFFKIVIVNLLLTLITFGIYYPWAKARTLDYIYGSAELNGNRFTFHGTGKEMFIGFIKAIALVIIIFAIYTALIYFEFLAIGTLFLYLTVLALFPLIIHGSYRYRMSRTSYKGIRLGYRGNKNELMKEFYKGIFFTIITIGFYVPWLTIKLRNYTLSHIKLGDINLKSDADGSTYFGVHFLGYLATVITFGIYSFWYIKDLFEFYVNNLSATKGDKSVKFRSTATAGGFFTLIVVNALLVIFTLGLATPWATINVYKFILDNIKIEGDIDLDSIVQTEEDYNDATGEDLGDFFDFDLVI